MSMLGSGSKEGSRRRVDLGILRGDEGRWKAECECDIYQKVEDTAILLSRLKYA